MDGVLTIPDEPTIATIDPVGSMPDDGLPSPDSDDMPAAHNAGADDAEPSTDNRQPTADNPIEIIPMRVVEAILFASDSPLPPAKIASILGVGDARDVRKHIAALNEHYEAAGNAFRVEEIAGGFRMMTLPAYNRWLTKLLRARQETKLTGAAMETLAIVAYKQPCTRADIEAVRGVAAGDILNRLREMNMIKIVGRAEDLGRPLLYGTTKRFLEVFGLAGLEDLPQVDALKGGQAAKTVIMPTETDAATTAETTAPGPEPECSQSGRAAGDASKEPTAVANDADNVELRPTDTTTDASQDGVIRFPHEASADLAPPDDHAIDHPPPKAVVTPRKGRARKPKDEPPSE